MVALIADNRVSHGIKNGRSHRVAPTDFNMTFNPQIQHRHSIRLKDYDYSQSGAYFITICTHDRELVFNPELVQEMLRTVWKKIPVKFPTVQLDEFVVRPNHIHGIILLKGQIENGRPHRVAPTLGDIIAWYKTRTTNAYIKGVKTECWAPFNGKFWQRNYFEHIIRNEDDLNQIRQYILDNPLKWEEDEDNPRRKNGCRGNPAWLPKRHGTTTWGKKRASTQGRQ